MAAASTIVPGSHWSCAQVRYHSAVAIEVTADPSFPAPKQEGVGSICSTSYGVKDLPASRTSALVRQPCRHIESG